eukprot:TRINITY_DN7957_c0_g2_i11.p6 TRINITY_DN7957_c0_g2~~TRINITY_DN7957_c0_g2_i11.p6  ORF type:complete len:118 (-),score=5.75 TRINITY_DN7957_c0_g2_i11:110-463(-)
MLRKSHKLSNPFQKFLAVEKYIKSKYFQETSTFSQSSLVNMHAYNRGVSRHPENYVAANLNRVANHRNIATQCKIRNARFEMQTFFSTTISRQKMQKNVNYPNLKKLLLVLCELFYT